MKGFKIDVVNQKITEVEINSLKDSQDIVGGHIALAHEVGQGLNRHYTNTFYCNDEGLLSNEPLLDGCAIRGASNDFFAGDLVVIGTDLKTGESVDSDLSIRKLEEIITFRSLIQF